MRAHLLLIDEDVDALRQLVPHLESAGYTASCATNADEVITGLAMRRPQVVIADAASRGPHGTDLFDAICRIYPTVPVIVISTVGTAADALEAMRRGIFAYVSRTDDVQTLLSEVQRAVNVGNPGWGEEGEHWCAEIITRNPAVKALLAQARLVAAGEARVLIYGKSGTGKELLARAIHAASPRRHAPFLAINCGAIPEHLLESELFGHVKGAFTGAVRDHSGLFQAAKGGTLFLDEIGDIPPSLQVKLLRVLEERQVRPVGATGSVPVDVRILSATNRCLEDEIMAGRFREDLYYRLNVVLLHLPSLAERRDDIALLATHFLRRLSEKYDKSIAGIEPDALEVLAAASWPGNARQLFNVIEHAVVLAQGNVITRTMIESVVGPSETMASLREARFEFERDYLQRLLRLTKGNVTHAARAAKRNRTEFYKLMQRHAIDPSSFNP